MHLRGTMRRDVSV